MPVKFAGSNVVRTSKSTRSFNIEKALIKRSWYIHIVSLHLSLQKMSQVSTTEAGLSFARPFFLKVDENYTTKFNTGSRFCFVSTTEASCLEAALTEVPKEAENYNEILKCLFYSYVSHWQTLI